MWTSEYIQLFLHTFITETAKHAAQVPAVNQTYNLQTKTWELWTVNEENDDISVVTQRSPVNKPFLPQE